MGLDRGKKYQTEGEMQTAGSGSLRTALRAHNKN